MRLKSISSMRGMSVVRGDKPLGRCVTAQLSQDLKRLDGVWYASGFGGVRLIDAESICLIGERSIIADAEGQRVRFKPRPLFLRAVSTGGERIGAVVDAKIDAVSLIVLSLTISTGYIDDIAGNRRESSVFTRDALNNRVVLSDIM